MSDSPIKSQRGFTLLEIMVAVSIIAIVSTAVYQMHFFSLSESHRSRLEALCLVLAQEKLAEIEASSLDAWKSAVGDFGEDFKDFRWEVSVEDIDTDTLKEIGKDLKRVDLRVFSDRTSVAYATRIYRFVR